MRAVLRALVVIVGVALLWVAAGGRGLAEGPWPPPWPSFSPPACGVGGEVAVRWDIADGAPPYTVNVAGFPTVTTDAESVDIPCADIRARFEGRALQRHVQAMLPVRVVDANGVELSARARLLLLSSAPQHAPPDATFVVGYTDVHMYFDRWQFARTMHDRQPTDDEVVPALAIGRYRKVGAAAWIYATPYPGPSPSCSGYTPPHATDLEPDTEYEVQLAWVWYVGAPDAEGYHISGLGRVRRPDYDWAREQGSDRWWRDWNDAEALRWSAPQRFRTLAGELEPTAIATDDTVRVRWPSGGGHYTVTATSADWPGVIWLDQENVWRRSAEDGIVTSTMSGLPADTLFDVQVTRSVAPGFAEPPPTNITVRTVPAGLDDAPRAADPGDMIIEPAAGRLRLQWSPTTIYTGLSLVAAEHPSKSFWDWDTVSGYAPDRLTDGRLELVVPAHQSAWALRLYVNRMPYGDDTMAPYMCAVWDIRMRPANPDLHFDRYLFSTWGELEQAVVPGRIPDDHLELWRHCRFADPL